MSLPRILGLASGTPTSGGSGLEKLFEATKNGTLQAKIIGVVCNYPNGGVRVRADRLGIPFIPFQGPYIEEEYRGIFQRYEPDLVALTGWLKLISGHDPRITINIHPGNLTMPGRPDHFGGHNMFGHHVHEASIEAYRRKVITHSAACMHFVSETSSDDKTQYDVGPVFFRHFVHISPEDTAETLAANVNKVEHQHQPGITNMVVQGLISWDGKDPTSLQVPERYDIDQYPYTYT
ncbi:hypothetical protein KW782_00880 [Candidatus Parcubacteria bacterium]|nr:hypothetical protein [Candidatus Parcubacteria bacterium]